MDGSVQITNKQHHQQSTPKFYELLANAGSPLSHHGQGLEMMMRTLENEANNIHNNDNSRGNQSHPQNNSRTETSHLGENVAVTTATLELHPNVVLQNLGLGDDLAEDRPHMCQVCRATYKTRTHLRRHMFVHLSNRPYPCSECGKGFNRKEHLNKHIEAVHSGTKYKCQFCGKEISRKDHLSRHIKNMHSSFLGSSIKTEPANPDDSSLIKVQLPCGLKQKAQLSFLTPNFASGAVGNVIGDTIITPIHNSTPNMVSQKGNRLKQNQLQQQDLSPGQMMMLPGNMMVTPTTISATPKSSVGCRINTNGTAAASNHINLNLNLNFGQLRNSALSASVTSSPGGEKKMLLQLFTCAECTATFTTEKDLTIHSRTHKPQPYKCTECPRAYTRREKLTEHIRCFHQGQKFTCEYCGKELSRKDHVLRHVRSVHPEVLANRFVTIAEGGGIDTGGDQMRTSNSAPLQGNNGSNIPSMGDMGVLLRSVCHICLKVFGTSYHLSRHIESCHNGDIRPYACTACAKQFKRKDHLTKHMKSHCPSMRDPSIPSRTSSGSRNSHINVNNHLSIHHNNTNTENSATLNHLDAELADIHPDAIESLQIEMMSPEGDEDDDNGNSANLGSNGEDTGIDEDNDEDDEDEMEDGDVGGSNESIVRKLKYQHENDDEENCKQLNKTDIGRTESYAEGDFNMAVINSFMETNSGTGNSHRNQNLKNDISNILHHNSSGTPRNGAPSQTFPCGHCQKEFTARDKLIDHLQEHSNDDLMQPMNSHQSSNSVAHGQLQHHHHDNSAPNNNNTSNSSLWNH